MGPDFGETAVMSAIASVAALDAGSPRFGELLRAWRGARKLSQLDLALQADLSQRHLSFLESGRAQPSRQMVLQVAQTLDVPLRERNALLQAAGYAPLYQERNLDSADMTAVREALKLTLAHHEPLPALVVNRCWGMVMSNAATSRILGLLGGEPKEVWRRVDPSGQLNVMRLTFHPEGLQRVLKNWEQAATVLLSRLQREAAAQPANSQLCAVLKEIVTYPGIPARWRTAALTSAPPPILPLHFDNGRESFSLFSMVSTFGTAQDVTADELRVETFFPADEATTKLFRGSGPT